MAFPTLGELRDAVRLLGDFPSIANPNAATLNLCINAELADLWERYSLLDPKSLETNEEIVLVANEAFYDLPVDFGVERVVFHANASDKCRIMERLNYDNIDVFVNTPGPPSHVLMYGFIYSGRILFWPIEAIRTGEKVNIVHIPQPPVLVDSEDEVADVPIAWKDCLILGAIARLCVREEQDPAPWLQQKAIVLERILDTARARKGGPGKVRDVNRRNLHYDS